MRVTVTLDAVHCFTPEDDLPPEDEFYVRHRISDPRGAPKDFKRNPVGQFTAGTSMTPGTVLINNETFTPGRSVLEVQAMDEDGVSQQTMQDTLEGSIAAGNPLGGLFMLGIFGLINLIDQDDFLGGHRQTLHMPPIVVINGTPQIYPMFAQGIPYSFRANRDGADYFVLYKVQYSF